MLIWMRPRLTSLNIDATTERLRARLLLGVLSLLPALAVARDLSHDEALTLTEQGRIAPLQQFIDDALNRYPGRFLEAELELDDGRYIYELEVVTGDHRVMELEYDAVSGELLDVEEDD